MAKAQGKPAKTGSKADDRNLAPSTTVDRGIGSSYAFAVGAAMQEKESTTSFLGQEKKTISAETMDSLVKGKF